jgi:hypothetical protein
MYREYLMQVRHDDRLRRAAKDQLAAQARRERAARRRDTGPGSVRRLMRALPGLANRLGAARQPVLSAASEKHEQIASPPIHLMAGAIDAPTPSSRPGRDETTEPCARI